MTQELPMSLVSTWLLLDTALRVALAYQQIVAWDVRLAIVILRPPHGQHALVVHWSACWQKFVTRSKGREGF